MEHDALLRTVELSDCKVFIEWFEETQTENNAGVKEAVDRLSNRELSGIWTVFIKWVMKSTNAFPNSEPADRESMYSTFSTMSSMAIYSMENLSFTEPQTLGPAVKALNSVLKSVTCKKAGTLMCQMSEKYWKNHPELELSLAVNVIYWYLSQALLPKAPASSMKSAWSVKDSLLKLDVDVLENSGILALLLSGISNSKFLASSEGKKCISCLFNFGANITQMLKETVKKFIPIASVNDCEALGEVFFRGWRTITSEQFRADVEFSIQDIMYSAVLAHRKPVGVVEGGVNKIPMNKLLFHLLHAIHRQKKQRTIAILIYALYKPILWRYLEVANGMVRANALCLFFDAFPFESGEGIEEDEVVRNKQWGVMLAALMDPLPLVRSIAIQGTSRVFAEYWELIPIDIIQKIITCMFRKLLFDSSSTDVRAQVVKGLAIMLESSQTHILLEKMLKSTNKVLHDSQEKVRVEYVGLLSQIQKLKVSKLWDVIDVNELVVRLAVDTSKPVCRRLVVLLAPFYHPKSQPEVVLQRCLGLVMENRDASRKFYLHIHQCIGIQQMTELILIIWKFLRNHILKQLEQMRLNSEREEAEATARQQKRRPAGAKRSRRNEPTQEPPETSNGSDENKENHASSDSENNNENDDHDINLSEDNILGLLDVVCVLLNTNKPKFITPPNVKYWDNIKSRYNKTCSMFFRYFRNSEGLRTIIYLYGQLSSSSSPMMLTFVKSQLKSLDDEANVKEFSHLVDVMCNWNRGEDLLEFISDNVVGYLNAQQELAETSGHSTRGSRKKRVSFQKTTSDNKPLLGVHCMAYVLQSPQNKKIVFRLNLAQVEQFCSNLKQIMELVERDHEKLTNKESFVVFASKLYVRIVLVLTSAYKRDGEETRPKYLKMQDDIIEILNWVKRLISIEGFNSALENLIFDILSSINNLIMIHSIEWNVCLHFISAIQDFLDQVPRSDNIIMSLSSAHYVLELVWTRRTIEEDHDTQCDDQVTALIRKALECCSAAPGEEALTEAEASKAKDLLKNILEVCHHHGLTEHKSLRDILLVLISTVKEEMLQFLEDPENSITSIKDLPQASGAIVGALRTRNALAEMVFGEMFEDFKDNVDDVDLPSLGVVSTLINIISHDLGRITTKTLTQAVNSINQLWSSASELEKGSNKPLANSISDTIKELKATLKC